MASCFQTGIYTLFPPVDFAFVVLCRVGCLGVTGVIKSSAQTLKVSKSVVLTLWHPKQPKVHRVLAVFECNKFKAYFNMLTKGSKIDRHIRSILVYLGSSFA